jgi:hypothetical protein
MADGFVENQAAMAGDGDNRAGQLAGFDLGVQRGDDPGEPRGGHADCFRFGARQRVFVCCGSGHTAPPGSAAVHSRNPQQACRTEWGRVNPGAPDACQK